MKGSQSCRHPGEEAHLLGTFGLLNQSLGEENREGNYTKRRDGDFQESFNHYGRTGKRAVREITDVPPILSMTAPRTRPEQVSNTKTLLPAWTFASVNIWASVSCRKWLAYNTKGTTSHTLLFLLRTSPHLFINPHDTSPDLPRFSAVVHHRQDATGRFQNHHSVFVPGKRRDENKLK